MSAKADFSVSLRLLCKLNIGGFWLAKDESRRYK
jgi:hypothetical protein